MGKYMKTYNSSPKNHKYYRKSWLVGMLHMLNFHHRRTKNRPICWRTPRTYSLARETDEQEPFLDSKNKDSKILSVVAAEKPREQQLKKMMTTKQVTEYVDFLEILRKEEVFVKVLKDSNSSKFWKQVQIKSNPRMLPKSSTFPLSRSPRRPARIEHKQMEKWFAPKQNETVLTLKIPTNTHKHDHGFNHAVVSGFREIKKFLKNALKDRKNTKKKKKKKKYLAISKDDSMERYYHLLEKSFRREGVGELRSKSLKLSNEERKSDSSDDNKPQFFRRVSSLSSLEVLGSFLTDLPRDSSTSNQETRKSVDRDSSFRSKKSLSLSEYPIKTEKEESKDKEQEQRSQESSIDILNQISNSAPSIEFSDDTARKEETLLTQSKLLNLINHPLMRERYENLNSIVACSAGLGLSSVEINKEGSKEVEDAYFCYVKNVLKLSGFLENQENVEKWHSEEHPLNPSLLYELDIHEEAMEKELLFDLVNEEIAETETQSHIYFPKTFSFAYEKRFLDEVWRRVKWSLYGLGDENRDRSLDDIVGRDLTKVDGWMNLRVESEWLSLEVEDMIFDEVLDEILCFLLV